MDHWVFLAIKGDDIYVVSVAVPPSQGMAPLFPPLNAMKTAPAYKVEPSHSRGAREVPEPLTLGAQYLTRYKTWKKFVRAT